MGRQALVEEDMAAAPNIEDILIHMSFLGTMGKATKALLVMAIRGLDVGLWKMVMTRTDSRKVIRYVDNTLVKAMVSECLSSEGEFNYFTVHIIFTLCFW
jgi:hypothetical protein